MDINRINGVKELVWYDITEHRTASFMKTLKNLASLDGLTLERAHRRLTELTLNPLFHIFAALTPDDDIVSVTTLFIEPKIIHNAGYVGHIEDVATQKGYENRGIGSLVMRAALDCAWRHGCYKTILDCGDHRVSFYENLGFRRHENCMRINRPENFAPVSFVYRSDL